MILIQQRFHTGLEFPWCDEYSFDAINMEIEPVNAPADVDWGERGVQQFPGDLMKVRLTVDHIADGGSQSIAFSGAIPDVVRFAAEFKDLVDAAAAIPEGARALDSSRLLDRES